MPCAPGVPRVRLCALSHPSTHRWHSWHSWHPCSCYPVSVKRLRVGVLYGGRSGEHEVSLASAAAVFGNLDRTRYEPIAIRIVPPVGTRILVPMNLPQPVPREVAADGGNLQRLTRTYFDQHPPAARSKRGRLRPRSAIGRPPHNRRRRARLPARRTRPPRFEHPLIVPIRRCPLPDRRPKRRPMGFPAPKCGGSRYP